MEPSAIDKTLLQKILAFEIDTESPQLTFARRLALENGWPLPFAERVVVEYKRYLFLAVSSDLPVTPSEHVDEAWHLHLTYTESYWDRMCGEVLMRPLAPQSNARRRTRGRQVLQLVREHVGALSERVFNRSANGHLALAASPIRHIDRAAKGLPATLLDRAETTKAHRPGRVAAARGGLRRGGVEDERLDSDCPHDAGGSIRRIGDWKVNLECRVRKVAGEIAFLAR